MTKREILDRLRATMYHAHGEQAGDGPERKVDPLMFRDVMKDLAADVRDEETPRRPEDDGSQPIATFADARRRVQAVRDYIGDSGAGGTPLAVMLRVLCADLIDAHNEHPVPDPTSVSVLVPPGFRVVVERNKPSKRE